MDPVAMCADTTAAWHSAWLDALLLRWLRGPRVWRALDAPPVIYWTGITLSPDALPDELGELQGGVCDSWSSLDLGRIGFEERMREPWFVRPAGELPRIELPPALELVHVTRPAQVEEFEEVSVRGFGGDDAAVEAGTFHPPSVLADRRMAMLIGRVDGSAVAAAMSYRGGSAIGIYGVTTVGAARGRGYATALTLALIDPALPAILSPSPEAESLYRRIGFEQVGELRQWQRG